MSLFLIIRIMQQPVSMPLHFRSQLCGIWWSEPFGDWVGVLNVVIKGLLDAGFDNLRSSGNPIC